MSKANAVGYIYLIHFDTPLCHARHYLGWTEDMPGRIETHRAGRGAKLLSVLRGLGIGWRVARIWCDATKKNERTLKKRAKPPLCPLCQGKPADVPERFRGIPLSTIDI